ncbi:hypothetical protein ZIOFF_057869 [Zingiber officinale]|uniref:Pulmonary surfactant-associated protein B n=1 Tax=Zingiber officinale TaxID=94328 RepID=A0A8J5F855_ZINOF|nr:hypothetical protein ZIOFF_057869 [Zingiber officinale]
MMRRYLNLEAVTGCVAVSQKKEAAELWGEGGPVLLTMLVLYYPFRGKSVVGQIDIVDEVMERRELREAIAPCNCEGKVAGSVVPVKSDKLADLIKADKVERRVLGVEGIQWIRTVDNEIQSESHIVRNEKLCTLCKEFASQALYYLGVLPFVLECVTLVDYYAPLFFLEVSKTSPEEFCDKVNLCDSNAQVSLPKHDNACTLCQDILGEVLSKLQDPDTELEVIEILLKGCNKMENFVQKCKKLVFQYGPLILANAEKLLEKTDLCTSIHACKTSQQVAETILASA